MSVFVTHYLICC